MLKKRKFWIRMLLGLVLVPILLIGLLIGLLYAKQDTAVQKLLDTFNEDFVGEVGIGESHISPFTNFPHITIDLEDVHVWEGKDKHDIRPIIEVEDVYLGFNLWTIITGTFDISFIRVENGEFDLILHEDGSFNVMNALASPNVKEVEDVAEEFHIHLKSIQLKNLDIHKYDEVSKLDVEAFVYNANASFKSTPGHIGAELESQFLLNVIDNGDTTVIKHKHFDIDTHLDYLEEDSLLVINPSQILLEHGVFGIDGSLDIMDSLNLDLNIHGDKPNFDLFIAFAPEELIPTLEQYENAGDIYFEGTVKGKAVDGIPAIEVNFGCDKAYFRNTYTNRTVKEMHFDGYFSNLLNPSHDLSAMEFSIRNFDFKPEAGSFHGDVKVKNFDSPDINVELNSDFNLDFLAEFLNIQGLENLDGHVLLQMKFHDIIDLANPEKSIERLNEAYFSELRIENLTFSTPLYGLPIKDLDARAHMDGHEANIDYVDIKIGNSNLHLEGMISDLPAILHHTDKLVDCKLLIGSDRLNLKQLTAAIPSADSTKKPFDEEISDLRMKLDFKSSAKAFTESRHLPTGEFFVEDLYARLRHYPHTLHDFHADVYIDENDLRIVDFSGEIDTTDFHFIGKLHDYGFWFADTLWGDTRVEFDLLSDHMRLEDLFAYKGENHVPEDYRHEELSELKIHGLADLHFRDKFQSADVKFTRVDARMKVHPLKFRNFKGRVHYENDHIQVDTLFGQIGKSSFTADLNYYIGEDESIRKRDNHLGLHADRLDMDELMNYNPAPTRPGAPTETDHEEAFNIFEIPFTPMTIDLDVKHLNYHRYLVHNLVLKARTERNHTIALDTVHLDAAGGKVQLAGDFDGTNPDRIFFDTRLYLQGVDLDKLLFKFENFGQDHVVAENLHGQLSGKVSGHIHMHPDLVPKMDDSELHIDIEVLDGRLANYEPLLAMAEYFGDKNLASVRFDSLENVLHMKNGELDIPRMTLNTSLGHLDLSGTQGMEEPYPMDYYVHIPLKMVSEVAKQKLFGKKNKAEADSAAVAAAEEDEVIFKDQTKKRIRYLNVKITGDAEDYKIKLGKKKKGRRRKNKEEATEDSNP